MPPAGTVRPPVLVVGVGSQLRSDDAAGRRVAELLADGHGCEQVEVRTVHQLTPELADAMIGRTLVVVVDASVEVSEVTTAPVTATAATGAMSHHLDAAALVGLARLLGRPPDQVTTLAVPAHDLQLGTDLSPRTAAAVADAVERVAELCRAALRGR